MRLLLSLLGGGGGWEIGQVVECGEVFGRRLKLALVTVFAFHRRISNRFSIFCPILFLSCRRLGSSVTCSCNTSGKIVNGKPLSLENATICPVLEPASFPRHFLLLFFGLFQMAASTNILIRIRLLFFIEGWVFMFHIMLQSKNQKNMRKMLI